MDKLSRHAFELYGSRRRLQFPESELVMLENELKSDSQGQNINNKLKRAFGELRSTSLVESVIPLRPPQGDNGSGHSKAQYDTTFESRHQLLQDYLVARHLALNEREWTDLGFDAATWRTQNSEPLDMAVEYMSPNRAP